MSINEGFLCLVLVVRYMFRRSYARLTIELRGKNLASSYNGFSHRRHCTIRHREFGAIGFMSIRNKSGGTLVKPNFASADTWS